MTAAVTAITGGIGAGKAVVSRILRAMGHEVYDSDSEARRLMDADPAIHAALCRDIHPVAVVDGRIDRPLISSVVFADEAALARLNSIVHSRVTADFAARAAACRDGRIFIETAILDTCAPLHPLIGEIWEVTAPEELRIARVQRRSGLSAAQVRSRIDAQHTPPAAALAAIPRHAIINDGAAPLLPQLHALL